MRSPAFAKHDLDFVQDVIFDIIDWFFKIGEQEEKEGLDEEETTSAEYEQAKNEGEDETVHSENEQKRDEKKEGTGKESKDEEESEMRNEDEEEADERTKENTPREKEVINFKNPELFFHNLYYKL